VYKKRNIILITFIIISVFLPVHVFTQTVTDRNGMVVSVDEYASNIGVEILKEGGNAVDAAVAVGFALAVTYPPAGNIGGGGFMIIRFPDTGKSVAVDFREKAPGKASPDMYLDENGNYVRDRSYTGHLAVGVPGTVRGFELVMKKYGTLSWEKVIEPAIKLAEKGFVLNERMADSFNSMKKRFKNCDELLRIFSKADNSDFKEGDIFIQKDLAKSLELIAENGSEAFYKGKIAELIVRDMEKHGGLITEDDLLNYEAKIRKPVKGTYRDYDIISMPPPSSGGIILIEMLNILEGYPLGKMERYAPETLHVISETMKFAYLDRAKYLGDEDFVKVPVEMLTSKDYAKTIREKINPEKAVPSAVIGENILTVDESNETTHYSVIDKNGIAVSTTYTLNGGYGAGVIAEGTGILLNNEMADFNMKPGYTDERGLIGTDPNIIKPYKRMLSSMTPTIIVKDGRTHMITGSPGGRTIINTLLNVIINVIDFNMDIQNAVNAARIHHQWMPDLLRIENEEIPADAINSLREMGHNIDLRWRQGDAHSILIDPVTGIYYGAPDKRSNGVAAGY